MDIVKHCPNCGSVISEEDMEFCTECGSKRRAYHASADCFYKAVWLERFPDCIAAVCGDRIHVVGNQYLDGYIFLCLADSCVFYSYDIPGGESRGAHAHKQCHQFLVAASGAFEVLLDDGVNKRTVLLNRPFYGLHVPPGIWAAEQGFSSGSICLVLASHGYEKEDYIRDYDDYLNYININK